MFEQIRSNQLRSIVLVVAMAAILLGLGYAIGILFFDSPLAGLIIALIFWFIMNLVAFFQGDSILLQVAGARKISQEDHPRLFNVVEEMKIASGLSNMPGVYIIDDAALNAFATGRSPEKASVAITSGLLQKLNRDELQGVIAHEIAHVKNRDVLLMTMAGILLGSIVILAWYASRMLFFSAMMGGSRRGGGGGGGGGGAQIIVLVIGVVLMILAPILAQLIYLALSRRREYLADASAALYTRYPEGLAAALEKLAASTNEVKSANQATAPMYIINPFRQKGKPASDLTSTHPSIQERVRILRSMGGGASLADYEQAYASVKGKGIVPRSALAGVALGAVPLRETGAGAEAVEAEPGKVQRTREVSDLMWRKQNYKTIECDCGDKLKVPPDFKRPHIKCPHCGRIHKV